MYNKYISKDKEYYTAQEVADKLQVNVMTFYCYIKKGKLNERKKRVSY